MKPALRPFLDNTCFVALDQRIVYDYVRVLLINTLCLLVQYIVGFQDVQEALVLGMTQRSHLNLRNNAVLRLELINEVLLGDGALILLFYHISIPNILDLCPQILKLTAIVAPDSHQILLFFLDLVEFAEFFRELLIIALLFRALLDWLLEHRHWE